MSSRRRASCSCLVCTRACVRVCVCVRLCVCVCVFVCVALPLGSSSIVPTLVLHVVVAAFGAAGCPYITLTTTSRYRKQLELCIMQHIFPELTSGHGFLRARYDRRRGVSWPVSGLCLLRDMATACACPASVLYRRRPRARARACASSPSPSVCLPLSHGPPPGL
jgi:hypothetical protein